MLPSLPPEVEVEVMKLITSIAWYPLQLDPLPMSRSLVCQETFNDLGWRLEQQQQHWRIELERFQAAFDLDTLHTNLA